MTGNPDMVPQVAFNDLAGEEQTRWAKELTYTSSALFAMREFPFLSTGSVWKPLEFGTPVPGLGSNTYQPPSTSRGPAASRVLTSSRQRTTPCLTQHSKAWLLSSDLKPRRPV